jgi:arylsulfatase A-like enzyme
MVHFTTAAMYYFTALAIGATGATFWEITFGSSIQIFATVISPFTIAGEGIREAAQLVLLGSLIGPAAAIVSAALGFWAAEAPTMLGFVFWWIRPTDYTPAYCRVDGVQVDYAEAAKAAIALESDEEKAARAVREEAADELPPLWDRMLEGAGMGFGAGVLAGIVIGVIESLVIANGGFGAEAQVLWYGPLAYALFLGGLALVGGAVLGVLPMDREEIHSWVPPLGLAATLIPFGLAITVFRLKRDVYLEQMPPAPVLLGVLAGAALLALLLLTLGRRFFAARPGMIARPLPAIGILVTVMVIGAIAAARVGGPSPESARGEIPAALRQSPNVILVMVDTLRADHLSCYGSEQVKTPNLCRLLTDGGSLYQGFSHASWTKPATASLLTSLLPSSHRAIAKPSALSPDVDMLAEVMQERGYTTGGIVSNINLAESFGFAQGYDEYHFLGPDYLALASESSSKLILYNIIRSVWFKVKPGIRAADFYQDSVTVNEVAFDWLDRNGEDRFFLFLHYMDPHDPYFEHPYDGHGIARVSNQHPDPGLADEMHRLYRGEIEYLDANFGKLLERLEGLGVYDDTVIALVSDHGEEFYEHGGWWHGLTLYEEQIHVPLLIKWAKSAPAPAASATEGLARLIDVAPTLIGVAGANVPATMQGIDLREPANERSEKDRQVFSEEDHEGNVLWSLRTEQSKLIAANEGNPRGLPTRELFAIDRDPDEQSPLDVTAHAGETEALERHADLQRRAAEGEAVAESGEAEMSYEECEQLRMLGYVDDCAHLRQ